ncbi:MAG: guanylate kinase [Xanthomonadales bacterium]|nr:guanylate kinase [Xanthomonadales bacterium]
MSNRTARRGQLYIVAAPSGGGKTSLIRSLLQRDEELSLSISHTTRPARPGETDGQHYHFVSVPEFEKMIEAGSFVEHARVFDHLYGTSYTAVVTQLEKGHDVLLDIDWQGARQVSAAFPDSCSIFVIPPSLEILRERLTRRAQDSASVIERRMRDARSEISHWDEFDHVVINDDFDTALEELLNIINDHRQQTPHPVNDDSRRLAQQLGRR